jgi:hypothetical protein
MFIILGNMNLAVLTLAVDFRQLPKVVFLFDFLRSSIELLAIAKNSILFRVEVKVNSTTFGNWQ